MIVISTIVSQTVICISLYQPMSPCAHEENNTIICVYLKDAMEKHVFKLGFMSGIWQGLKKIKLELICQS